MDTEEAPLIRVVRGAPTAEETTALVAAVLPRLRAAPPAPPARPSWWVRSARPQPRRNGLPLPPGPGAWRAAALPR